MKICCCAVARFSHAHCCHEGAFNSTVVLTKEVPTEKKEVSELVCRAASQQGNSGINANFLTMLTKKSFCKRQFFSLWIQQRTNIVGRKERWPKNVIGIGLHTLIYLCGECMTVELNLIYWPIGIAESK